MTPPLAQKQAGAYYTPDSVAQCLLHWAVRSEKDRLLDPSCGDGGFIAGHRNSVGIEQDVKAAQEAVKRAPWALVHEGDFFSWAGNTLERFECAAGNPPFIRYQNFSGAVREKALKLCSEAGAHFSGLTSSWAPFLVATATLLKPNARMAFVVPAEIGHAPYCAPLIEYLVSHFAVVHILAVRSKLFPELSADCWLLYADGHGAHTNEIRFSTTKQFRRMTAPPRTFTRIPIDDWRSTWRCRLRPFLLDSAARDLYQEALADAETHLLGQLATVGIGYVSGANNFFHLRPSEAERLEIPRQMLHPTVRNGRALPAKRLTASVVERWHRDDDPVLLLRIGKTARIPKSVERYLNSDAAQVARTAYKCSVRTPWYSVPDVQVPDFFLSYMSGLEASLVKNDAGCTCTNSVHSVRLRTGVRAQQVLRTWESPFTRLSCELEGHPLGGGMLKLEPGESTRIAFPSAETLDRMQGSVIDDALATMRKWRHYGDSH